MTAALTLHAVSLEEILEGYNQRLADANTWLHEQLGVLQTQVAIDLPAVPDIDAAAGLGPQPAAEESTGEAPAVVPDRPSPSSAPRVACPDCGATFDVRGLGPHRSRKHRAIETPAQVSEAAIGTAADEGQPAPAAEPSGTVGRSGDPGPPSGHRSPAAPRLVANNPRSKPPLDLPRRIDQAVGQ